MSAILIDLLRHGEPRGGRRYRGHGVDDPLSPRGWAQMLQTTAGIPPWQAIVSSPMQRCLPFAQHLSARLDIPLRVDDRFKEVGFGRWEGRSGAEISADDAEALPRFYADPHANRPDGAEPLAALVARVGAGLEEILDAGPGHTLIVCHAGVIRAALGHVLQQPLSLLYRFNIDTASVTRLRQSGGRPPSFDFVARRSW